MLAGCPIRLHDDGDAHLDPPARSVKVRDLEELSEALSVALPNVRTASNGLPVAHLIISVGVYAESLELPSNCSLNIVHLATGHNSGKLGASKQGTTPRRSSSARKQHERAEGSRGGREASEQVANDLRNLQLMVEVLNGQKDPVGFSWRSFKLTQLLQPLFESRVHAVAHAGHQNTQACSWGLQFAASVRKLSVSQKLSTLPRPLPASKLSLEEQLRRSHTQPLPAHLSIVRVCHSQA